MSHECFVCGSICHCGGDIDDCLLPGSEEESSCMCCVCKTCRHDFDDCVCECKGCSSPMHSCCCYNDEDDEANETDEHYAARMVEQRLEHEIGRGDYLRDRAKDEK